LKALKPGFPSRAVFTASNLYSTTRDVGVNEENSLIKP